MSISIRDVLLLGVLYVGALEACAGKSRLVDPSTGDAGRAGDGGGGSQEPGGGATAGTAAGAGNTGGGAAGSASGGSAQAGTASGGSAHAGTGNAGSTQAGTGNAGSAPAGTGGGEAATAGMGGGESAEGGMGGSESAGGGGEGGSADAYAPRSGSFEMLVYSRTLGFQHGSIDAGREMLQAIAEEQGFEVTLTDTNEDITLEGLSKYEIVFFLNSSGDVFNADEEQAFETWMKTRNGAYAGMHSAMDTESQWPFYKEMTGQYHDGNSNITPGEIVIQDAGRDFPGLSGVPTPWLRNDEWFELNDHEQWSAKEGFQILARHGGDDHPVCWIREFANFRSFYTSLGHESQAYEDELVKRHVAGGIMWAVRREHLFR